MIRRADSEESSANRPPAAGSAPARQQTEIPPPEIAGLVDFVIVGRGGSGAVYRAIDSASGRKVAVKVLLAAEAMSPSARARARREAAILASLRHPNIVRIEASGELRSSPGWPDGVPFLVMEWIPGDTLERCVGGRRLPPREAVRVVRDLAWALEEVHSRGIVHRDVKPANVLLLPADDAPIAKLIDFGLALPGGEHDRLTRSSTILGTPGYMAPEQLGDGEGLGGVGPRTDLHGLAATLFFLLHGRPPHEGRTAAESLARAATGAVDWTPPRGGAIPPALRAILETAMEREPARRYASAIALADDLDRFLDGRPIAARRTGWTRRGLAWARRQPVTALVTVAAVLSAAGVAVALAGAWWHVRRISHASATAATARDLSRTSLASLADESVARMIARGSALDESDLAYLRRVRGLYRDWPLEPDRRVALAERIEAFHRLAAIFRKIARIDDADECFRDAIADCSLLERAGEDRDRAETMLFDLLREYGSMLVDADRAEEAEWPLQRAVGIASRWTVGDAPGRDTLLPTATLDLALALDRQGRHAEARSLVARGLSMWSEVRRAWPDDVSVARGELHSLFAAAAVTPTPENLDLRRARLDVLGALAKDAKRRFPDEDAAITRIEVLGLAAKADLEQQADDPQASLTAALALEEIVRELHEADPADAFFREELIEAAIRVAAATTTLGRPDESLERMREAVAMARREHAAEPAVLRQVLRYTKSLQAIESLHRRAGRPAEAIVACKEIVAVLEPWLASDAANGPIRLIAGGARMEIGSILLREMRAPVAAVESLRRAAEIVPPQGLAEVQLAIGESSLAAGDLAAARTALAAVRDDPRIGQRARRILEEIGDPEIDAPR